MHEARERIAASRHEPEGLGDDVMVHHRVRDAVREQIPVLELLFFRRRIHVPLAFPLLRDAFQGFLGLMMRGLFAV